MNGEKIEHLLQSEYISPISFFLEDIISWKEYPFKDYFTNKDSKTVVNFHNGEHCIVLIDFYKFTEIMAIYKKQESDLKRLIISN